MTMQSPELPEPIPTEPSIDPARWSLWDLVFALVLGLIIGGVLVAVAGLVFAVLAESPSDVVIFSVATICIYAGVFLGIYLLVFKRRSVSPSDVGLTRAPSGAIVKMLPVSIGVLFLNAVVIAVTSSVFGEVPTAQDQLMAEDEMSLSATELVWLLLAGAVAAPFVEELVFRGLLYGRLARRWSLWPAAIVSALVFAAVHLIGPLIPALFVLGLVLAWVTHKYESLYPAITLHGINNAIAIGLVYAAVNGT